MTFIAGPFTATFNGKALGATEDGYEQITNVLTEEIRADHYGGNLDGIFKGIDMMIRCVLLEVDMPGVRDLIWPWDGDADGVIGTSAGELVADFGNVAGVGTLLSTYAKALVLTPCSGTTAATKGKWADSGGTLTPSALTSITYSKAVIAADSQSLRFSSTLRKLAVTIMILPTDLVSPTAPGATQICGGRNYFTIA